MAERTRGIEMDFEDDDHPQAGVKRLALWGAVACLAVAGLAAAASSDIGAQRLAAVLGRSPAPAQIASVPQASTRGSSQVAQTSPRGLESDLEARRLSEAVRLLAADRDRLLARLSALERNLDDVTGSIPAGSGGGVANPSSSPSSSPLPPTSSVMTRVQPPQSVPPAAAQAPSVQPAPQASVPQTQGPPQGATPQTQQPTAQAPAPQRQQLAAIPPQAAAPAARPSAGQASGASESVATKTEFGIDIGGGTSFESVRGLWERVREQNGALFEGLKPVVSIREGKRPGAIELRLVAGPLPNAGVAARLCAALGAAGLACEPAVYDGQRLALR